MSLLLVILAIFGVCMLLSVILSHAFSKDNDQSSCDNLERRPHDTFYITKDGKLGEKRNNKVRYSTLESDDDEEEDLWFFALNECDKDEEWYDDTFTC